MFRWAAVFKLHSRDELSRPRKLLQSARYLSERRVYEWCNSTRFPTGRFPVSVHQHSYAAAAGVMRGAP